MFQSLVVRSRVAGILSALVALVLAVGIGGLTASPASADAGSEPLNVTLTWDGATSLGATWDPPADPGPDPDRYWVHLEGWDAAGDIDVDIDDVMVTYVPGAAEYDFGSQPTTNEYFVSITLIDGDDNSGDYGYGSTPAFPVAASDIGVFSAGQNVTVYWTQAEDYSDTVSEVTLEGDDVTYDQTATTSVNSTFADFTGVPVGTYTATVTATNVSGVGPTVSQSLLVVDGHDSPSAARSVSAVNSSPNKVTVSWDSPESDGGEPVSEYIVGVDDGGDFSYTFTAGDARSVTIEADIKLGTWPVRVYASNSRGTSDVATTTVTVAAPLAPVVTPPVTAPVVTPPVVVNEPVPAAVTKADSSRVKEGGVTTITWKAPTKVAGAPVLRYTLTVGDRVKTVKTTKAKIKGLRAGSHKVKVRAVSKNGVSKPVVVKVKVKKAVAMAAKPSLRSGDDSPAVKKLQKALHMPVKARSGDFDKATRAAVKAWQKSHGLAKTGVVNDAMRFALSI